MENFSSNLRTIKIAGRIATEVVINFANFHAARLVIDRLTGLGGQLNLNISPQCLQIPECANNVLEYVGLALIGIGVIRLVEQIFWRRVTKGKKGDMRYDGGFRGG